MAEEVRTTRNGTERTKYRITCPYCFKEFYDNEVHFRFRFLAEQQKAQRSRIGRGYDDEDEDDDVALSQNKGDEKYAHFWQAYTRSSEDTVKGIDPYMIPVFSPKEHKKYFAQGDPLLRADNKPDGMVYGALYSDGTTRLTERVCPYCHNPLMGSYGRYPTKFISVIGVTAAGKTVFLSQMCKYIQASLAGSYGMSAQPTSPYADKYMMDNYVDMGRPLPGSTQPEQFLQPLCYDISYNVPDGMGGKKKVVNTVVFYDIAGENCTDAAKMQNFGSFIEHSDGIILLIPPRQFQPDPDNMDQYVANQPSVVLTTIYNSISPSKPSIKDVPIAVCISQGDLLAQDILRQNLTDIVNDGETTFNADEYNEIHEKIMEFLSVNQVALCTTLETNYDNYNYFMVSALGTGVDPETQTPNGPTVPLRIMEPITWLMTKFEFLDTSGFVYQPEDWKCPVCGERYHNSPDSAFCRKDRVNSDGKWRCEKCGKFNDKDVKWCECKFDRFGNKMSLLDRFKK